MCIFWKFSVWLWLCCQLLLCTTWQFLLWCQIPGCLIHFNSPLCWEYRALLKYKISSIISIYLFNLIWTLSKNWGKEQPFFPHLNWCVCLAQNFTLINNCKGVLHRSKSDTMGREQWAKLLENSSIIQHFTACICEVYSNQLQEEYYYQCFHSLVQMIVVQMVVVIGLMQHHFALL